MRSRLPSQESITELLGDIPDDEIDVMCLRVMTTDKIIHHWHYAKDGRWVETIGTQG